MMKAQGQIVETQWQVIDTLNFERMKQKMLHGKRSMWTAETLARAEAGYRRFLKLAVKYPHMPVVPSEAVDEFWHAHILDTQRYAADCERIFGAPLHHNPYVGIDGPEDEARLMRMAEETNALMASEFSAEQADAAYCAVSAEGKAAYCAVSASGKAAYCAVAASSKAAYCAVSASDKAAYCAVAASSNAAYCAVSAPEKPAYCAVSASSSDAAYCAVAAAGKPAYCAVSASGKAAYCAVAAGVEAGAAPDTIAAAYCAVASLKAAAYCAVAAAPAYCAVDSVSSPARESAVQATRAA
ncbi:glycine-rich domain-containing protein [Trinickia terrae]|uniref:glycine-rich domain-containing protein n=1 Tax=Trinickia terrae TaxID=2571161 RepID=UPI001F115541|nr:hypothetical protein [Trinickia terrae]